MSEAILSYLAGTLWRGAVVWGLVTALELIFRRKLLTAHTRWLYGVLILLVLLPTEAVPIRTFHIPMPAPVSRWIAPITQEAAPTESGPMIPATGSGGAAVATGKPVAFVPTWADGVLALYLVIVAVLLIRLFRQIRRWRRRISVCPAITRGRTFEAFREVMTQAGLSGPPVILRDTETSLAGPACFGFGRNRTVLCCRADMDRHSDLELRMLLLHELGHLKHGDNPVGSVAAVVTRIWWCNPAVALLLNRMLLSGELAADRLVRERLNWKDAEQSAYAQLLLRYQLRTAALPRPAYSLLGGTARTLKLRILEFARPANRIRIAALSLLIFAVAAAAFFTTPVFGAAPAVPEQPEDNSALAALNRAIRNMETLSYHSRLAGKVRGDGTAQLEYFTQWVDPADGFVYQRRDFGRVTPGEPEIINQTNLVNRDGNYIYSPTHAIRRTGRTTSWPPQPVAAPGATVRVESPVEYRGIPCVRYTVTTPDRVGTRVYMVGRDNDFVYERNCFDDRGKQTEPSQSLGDITFDTEPALDRFRVPDRIQVTEVSNTDDVRQILFPEDFPAAGK